jgi:proteasome accessory factor A
MAIPKVCGIETEYGISVLGSPDANPITASSVLINAYINEAAGKIGWDFDGESPGNDARGFALEGALPPEIETHLVNSVLTNGARLYVDHAHPEYSSPECLTARSAVLYDAAGEEVMRRAMQAVERSRSIRESIVVYKNNSDRKGNSYGCHENYLMDRSVPFAKIVRQLIPFFVTRQIFCGAGKVGSEFSGIERGSVPFQLSQRADFFEEEVGLETTLKRPIINTRDEPHADATRYRRLHVIVGDANVSQFSTYLKLGVTALVLAMIEDGTLDDLDIVLSTPVASLREVSYDVGLTSTLSLTDGRRLNALAIQWEYFDRAMKYADREGLDAVGGDDEGRAILALWEETLRALENDPMTLADRLDWVAKLKVLNGYRQRHDALWDDSRLAAIDLQYHDLRPEKSLASRLNLRHIWEPADVKVAVGEPPKETRAYFRGKCLEKFSGSVAAANWDSLIFDIGRDPLRRVPMMDPLRGTAQHVDSLLKRSETASDLLEGLGA